MPVAAFPLFKLGFLLIKQVSQPIANAIAKRAKSSRIFREYVCIPVAQGFHWYDVKVRMKILNLGKVTRITKLNEEKAIETGSQLLSEFIILSIASSLLIFEYRRSSEKEETKQEMIEKEKREINEKLTDLEFTVDTQAAQIRELTRLIHAVEDRQRNRFNLFKKSQQPIVETSTTSTTTKSSLNDTNEDTDSSIEAKPIDFVLTHPLEDKLKEEDDYYYKGIITDAVQYYLDGCKES